MENSLEPGNRYCQRLHFVRRLFRHNPHFLQLFHEQLRRLLR